MKITSNLFDDANSNEWNNIKVRIPKLYLIFELFNGY